MRNHYVHQREKNTKEPEVKNQNELQKDSRGMGSQKDSKRIPKHGKRITNRQIFSMERLGFLKVGLLRISKKCEGGAK